MNKLERRVRDVSLVADKWVYRRGSGWIAVINDMPAQLPEDLDFRTLHGRNVRIDSKRYFIFNIEYKRGAADVDKAMGLVTREVRK